MLEGDCIIIMYVLELGEHLFSDDCCFLNARFYIVDNCMYVVSLSRLIYLLYMLKYPHYNLSLLLHY